MANVLILGNCPFINSVHLQGVHNTSLHYLGINY